MSRSSISSQARALSFTALTAFVTTSGCTPFKSYRSCDRDSDCAASLSACSPEGLCAPLQEGALPNGVTVLEGALSTAAEATVVGLLSRTLTPQLNLSMRGGVTLASALLPVSAQSGDRALLWLSSQPEEGGAEELVGRFKTLKSLGVDVIVTPTLTRSELETLQGELDGQGDNPSLFILSYEDPQPPPVSASFPVFAFNSTLSEPEGKSLPLTLSQALISARASEDEGEGRVTLIYDRDRASLEAYRTELEGRCEPMGLRCLTLPRDQRLEVAEQLSAWETLGLLPQEGVGELVIWAVDSTARERSALLEALYQQPSGSSPVEIEVIQLLGRIESEQLEDPDERPLIARQWSLQPPEHALLPSPISLSEGGRGLSLSWPDEVSDGVWLEAIQGLWIESAVSLELITAGAPLLARSFDVASLMTYVAQYVQAPEPFEHHLTLSQLLTSRSAEGTDQLKLYPAQAGLLSRPTALDERVSVSFYGLQGRLQFANQRAINLPLPHLTCQVPGGPLFAEHVPVNSSGALGAPEGILSRCRRE